MPTSGIGAVAGRASRGLLLLAAGVHWTTETRQQEGIKFLAGLSFVLTGTLESLSREEAKRRLGSLGAQISGSVSSKTSKPVTSSWVKTPGSKLAKAQELGVRLMHEAELLEILGACRLWKNLLRR